MIFFLLLLSLKYKSYVLILVLSLLKLTVQLPKLTMNSFEQDSSGWGTVAEFKLLRSFFHFYILSILWATVINVIINIES